MNDKGFQTIVRVVVVRLLWLSNRALVAQARGVLGSSPSDCRPFHFSLFLLLKIPFLFQTSFVIPTEGLDWHSHTRRSGYNGPSKLDYFSSTSTQTKEAGGSYYSLFSLILRNGYNRTFLCLLWPQCGCELLPEKKAMLPLFNSMKCALNTAKLMNSKLNCTKCYKINNEAVDGCCRSICRQGQDVPII